MWNLLHISSFCFICYLVGYVKPFFIYILVFVLHVMRWVCETLLDIFSFCFIRYEVGM